MTDPGNRLRRTERFAAILCAAALGFGTAQAQTPARRSTPEDAMRQQKLSDRWMGVMVHSLKWRTPLSQECQGVRQRIEGTAAPPPGLAASPIAPAGSETSLELAQRIEENLMARHSMMVGAVYDAVSNDCLDDSG